MKQKKQRKWPQYVVMACMVLMGAVFGAGMVAYGERLAETDSLSWRAILALLLGMYGASLIQVMIHEAGHLLFGLLTGYRFSSFRIFSFLWLKEDGKLQRKRLHIAGTAGQCLMTPPEPVDGEFPVVLYNLGGCILNALTGLLFLGVYILFRGHGVLDAAWLLLAVMGLCAALENVMPMQMGNVDNDGRNALSLRGNKTALRGFWVQMKVNGESTRGLRLREMPEEWFTVPDEKEMDNTMAAAQGCLACCRLMDEKRYEEADALMARLLEGDAALAGLHRSLLVCDRICCALLRGSKEEAAGLMTRQQRKFHKKMASFPSVIRTEYLYALLVEENRGKAEKLLARFEKTVKTYPSPQDIQAERELMAEVLAAR